MKYTIIKPFGIVLLFNSKYPGLMLAQLLLAIQQYNSCISESIRRWLENNMAAPSYKA